MALLDLLSLAVATRLGRVRAVPAESRQNAMLLRIQSFIGDHLGDPGLSPGMIAAAHHISVRTLHKLYQVQDQTISASIHWQRCRRTCSTPPCATVRSAPSAPAGDCPTPPPSAARSVPPTAYRPANTEQPSRAPASPHSARPQDHAPTPSDERGHDLALSKRALAD